MNFEQWLESKGFDPAAVSDAQRTYLQAAWRAEQNPPDPGKPKGGNDFDAVMDKFRAEEARQGRITALVSEAIEGTPGRREELEQIGRSALGGKWTEQQTELALLRAARPGSPPPANGRGPANAEVIEAAFAQHLGLPEKAGGYGERVMQAAHTQFKGGLGILQLLTLAAQSHGYRGTAAAKSNLREVMQYAFEPRADSGVSTINTSGILSNIANKFVRVGFTGVEQNLTKIAAKRSVSDFKTITSYSLTGDMMFQEIPPGGLIKHGTLGEVAYTNQAKSYGRMLGIDRRDLINDNAGAYSTVNKRLGRGGALKLNNVGWGTFLNNAAFFTAGNGTALTGGGSALSLAGLTAAEAAFRTLRDPDGNLMGVAPMTLLVPTALRATAWTLMNGTITVGTPAGNALAPNSNPFAGMFDVVDSAYLQDSTLTGYSPTAWYLLADPNDAPVIELCFLNGVEMPTVESTDADFNQLGIQVRGYWDFGASLQEYRGGVRSAGA